MRTTPLFSVIIPVFNNRETVARAIESVLAQTHPAVEIIVIDDGSADGAADLIQKVFRDRVNLIRFPENKGPSAARNAGIEAATGTHLAFLDADDSWLPQKLQRMADVLKTHPDAWLLFHDHALVPQISSPVSPKRFPLRGLLLRNPVATPCAVVCRSALRFDEKLRWMEDYDYFLRHAEAGPVYYLPETLTVLGRPILSAGGHSSRRWEMRKAEGQVILQFCLRHPAYIPVMPFWGAWPLVKHFVQEMKRGFKRS